eukprot:Lithocolla_globosa_v1_NODE_3312_length_1703_cov_6.825850.p1 type:complete len:164 gc:universal NODE_3312_length_1703_cov_6.825850:293-784(+)
MLCFFKTLVNSPLNSFDFNTSHINGIKGFIENHEKNTLYNKAASLGYKGEYNKPITFFESFIKAKTTPQTIKVPTIPKRLNPKYTKPFSAQARIDRKNRMKGVFKDAANRAIELNPETFRTKENKKFFINEFTYNNVKHTPANVFKILRRIVKHPLEMVLSIT